MRWILGIAVLAGCAPEREPEAWDDWYDAGSPYDVREPIAFTDQPYDFPADPGEGIGALLDVAARYKDRIAFGAGDPPPKGCTDWVTAAAGDLPFEIEGIVTVHPRFYFKTDGCVRGSDEKFYGSYFIQDATGGVFVLGDSKVAHFDMGDRVRMRVRAVRNKFDMVSVAAHDILEVERGPEPIWYQVDSDGFSFDDIGIVKRIEGTIVTDPDTFGEFAVENDDGLRWIVGLDVELNRRGVRYPVGTRVRITGPVLYSYSVFSLVVMRVGQIEVVDD